MRPFTPIITAFMFAVASSPAVAAMPANDDVAGAAALPPAPFTVTMATGGATRQAGEPVICGAVGATVWYSYTAPVDAMIVVDTLGSDFDTVLTAYLGTAFGEMTPLDCNDQTYGDLSEIFFPVIAGETYLIQAGGFDGQGGNLMLNGRAFHECVPRGAANDCFSMASSVANATIGVTGTVTGSNRDARAEPHEPRPCGASGRTMWFAWTAPVTKPVAVTTANSAYDTVLAVYTGPTVAELQMVGCNDDLPHSTSSALAFAAVAGTTYHIQVSGFASWYFDSWIESSGTFRLSIT